MNILHIDEQRGWRGGEQQAGYLIAGLVRRGHRVLIAGRSGGAFLKADHGVPGIIRLKAPFFGEGDPVTAIRLARAIRRYQVDIIHAHTSHAHSAACLARRLAGRGKVVVSRRVDFPVRLGIFNRRKYACPDRYIVISNKIADVLLAAGIREEKIEVVHSAIDPARFDVPPLPRSALGVPEHAPLLGNVAALAAHKDQATLIKAMPMVLRELPELRLLIAGEGAMRGALEAQIKDLGLERSVTLLGFRRDIPGLMRALDAFVLSSREEGLGTSVLDAMACGLPVVATAAGGIPEMVVHERTGLLAPVGDAEGLAREIVRIFRDRALAERLGRAGRALVRERFTVDRMVEGNLRVYEALLGRE
jgi:glycosyltransferase involved in cell wall biosynthesis